jgi:hypothetical protein
LDWQFGGFAADPATVFTGNSGHAAQWPMADFGRGSGAAEGLNTVFPSEAIVNASVANHCVFARCRFMISSAILPCKFHIARSSSRGVFFSFMTQSRATRYRPVTAAITVR